MRNDEIDLSIMMDSMMLNSGRNGLLAFTWYHDELLNTVSQWRSVTSYKY
jgi:hypothetical protein